MEAEGKAMFPMPSADEIKRAFRALGASENLDRRPDQLLRAAAAWLADWLAWEAPLASESEIFHGVGQSPQVDAIWTAFQCFGLPTYRPDYLDWLNAQKKETWMSGGMVANSSYTTLHMFIVAAHRSEQWSEGSWGLLVARGGLLAAARELLRRVRKGQWQAQWS